MNTTPRTTNEVLRKTKAAAKIVEHAEHTGLPIPYSVEANDLAAISLGFDTLAALTEWALWMESPVKEQPSEFGVSHHASGTALEEPIRVWTFTPKAALA